MKILSVPQYEETLKQSDTFKSSQQGEKKAPGAPMINWDGKHVATIPLVSLT